MAKEVHSDQKVLIYFLALSLFVSVFHSAFSVRYLVWPLKITMQLDMKDKITTVNVNAFKIEVNPSTHAGK